MNAFIIQLEEKCKMLTFLTPLSINDVADLKSYICGLMVFCGYSSEDTDDSQRALEAADGTTLAATQ